MDDFERVEDEGDFCWTRKVVLGNNRATVRIVDETYPQCVPHINAMLSEPEHLLASVEEFKREQQQAKEFRDYREEIANLQLESMMLGWYKGSVEGEVYFLGSPGYFWSCAYKDGIFYNLGFPKLVD